jgi:hypothetical protein
MSSAGTAVPSEWTFDEQAFLKKIPYPVVPTNVKGAYSGIAPPDDFDPNTATPAELLKNGLLFCRPTATDPPVLREAWQKVFSRKWLAKDRIIPVLEPQVGKRHVLKSPPKEIANKTYDTYNWAGAAGSGGPFVGVIGYWNVPTVSEPSEPAGEDFGWDSSSWCGIDGWGPVSPLSNDVLQAGIQQSVDQFGSAHYVAWYEWFTPFGPPPLYVDQTNISNFPVNPGDEICVYCNYVSKTAGAIYMLNLANGKHFSMTLAPPRHASFSGDTVEWIMECPGGGELVESLPKFTPVKFHTSSGCAARGGLNNPDTDNKLNIVNPATGEPLTKTTLGDYKITIDFTG